MKTTTLLLIMAAAVIFGAGYFALASNDKSAASETNYENSSLKLPSYAYTNSVTLSAYKYATAHPEILEQMPCYCGCGGHAGHASLRDCFIMNGVYDEHASFCDTCIGINVKVQNYIAQGKTIKETRTLIDNEYGARYPGAGTKTPPVV